MMSTIGTLICGSSSRGSEATAIRPATIAAISSSGVSGELMKARVRAPKARASWRHQHVAVLQAGENLDVRSCALAGLHDDLRAVGELDIVDAGAAVDA